MELGTGEDQLVKSTVSGKSSLKVEKGKLKKHLYCMLS